MKPPAYRPFVPDEAPHRDLVHQLVRDHVAPLHARVRGPRLLDLVRRLLHHQQRPAGFVELDRAGQLALLIRRTPIVLDELEADERTTIRAFADFSFLFSQLEDDDERKRMMADYLGETVRDRRRLRGDLRALDRDLGFDALRERSAGEVLAISVQIELALQFVAGALAALVATGEAGAAHVRDLIAGGLAEAVLRRMMAGGRWQIRLAAAAALVRVGEATAASRLTARPGVIDATRRTAHNGEEHPFVQGLAIEAVLLLDPTFGQDVVWNRLRGSDAGRRDFLVRKLALLAAARRLAPADVAAMLRFVIDGRDPSEHVRMGAAQAATTLAHDAALPLLRALAGLEPAVAEPSAKVRARAMIGLGSLLVGAAADARPAIARGIGDALAAAVAQESDAFALTVACEELAALAARLGGADDPPVGELAPAWQAALLRRVGDPATPPRAAEAAAAAAEEIERERDPRRRALTIALGDAVRAVRPGRRGVLRLDRLPAALAEAARDRALLARVLAELTRRDHGLSLSVAAGRLVFWRGDRFRRRLWRVLHELRNPLPSKRQAYRHTIGRTYPGELRAHPGQLDEATATTVPGERVTVDVEGSWGRHLPTVDDLLDLPLGSDAPVRVTSSLGVATLRAPASRWRRLRNRVLVAWRYRALAALRLASLRAIEPRERGRYLEVVRRDYGVAVDFAPHAHALATPAPVPRRVAWLFSRGDEGEAPTDRTVVLGSFAPLAALREWLGVHGPYFLSPTENSQTALAAFATVAAAGFLGAAYRGRRAIARARRALPLSLGGWGTRGKSGTERLKAGLLDGLGFQVFVKTTGCEAMFIHSAPLQEPVEIFIYRPYDKATIWEQRAMLQLAVRLRSEVFLWECMALNPKYVQLLQRDWMRDDLVTLTNSYPDHEDIQGPAGLDVARVITEFIPDRATLVTSETSYLPLFAETCAARGTTMHTVGERDAELIADEVLDLFPYREHPRNIALVSRVAEELGLDVDLARLLMADHVVPDLGVLKAYPPARVRGRRLTFVCGNSANERTGFINNWRRMKLDALDLAATPHQLVVTVVNNRADRIARSEVFARILVRDVAFDRHVLIGTNLRGLRGFLDAALTDYLAEQQLVEADELTSGAAPDLPLERLARELGNLRVPPPTAAHALVRLERWARAAGLAIAPDARAAIEAAIAGLLADPGDGPTSFAAVRREVDDGSVVGDVDRALAPLDAVDGDDPATPEVVEPPTRADLLDHLGFELARMKLRARLEARLRRLFDRRAPDALDGFRRDFAAAYRELFLAQVVVIDDPAATGDQIIDACARAVPPGTDVTLMGTQNIKGTGLDFVYRWLALDKVARCLAEIDGPRRERREQALVELEAFGDLGLVDAGLARAVLARPPRIQLSADEEAARQRIRVKVEEVYGGRRRALLERRQAGLVEAAAGLLEGWVDYLDSVRRGRRARQIVDDLVAQRISHGRASLEMRGLVARMKGGWLIKTLRR